MKTLLKSTALAALIALSWAAVATASLSDYFVDTAWLSDNRDSVTVVDVRVMPLYLIGHIDGALHIDKAQFLDKRRGVKSLILRPADLGKLLDKYGITPDTTVVAYAEDKNPYAARFVWTLRYHGHQKAYVLDGGYDKWSREERATSLLPTSAEGTSGYAVSSAEEIRAEADYILSRLGNPSVLVWDTRTPDEHMGTKVRAERGGHIPGVTHLNWVELQKEVNGVKVLKSEAEIVTLLSSKGITPDKEIIAHCQTGIRSAYATLVLLALDYPVAKNYDGSWIEWANDPFFPIENPSQAAIN